MKKLSFVYYNATVFFHKLNEVFKTSGRAAALEKYTCSILCQLVVIIIVYRRVLSYV